MTSIINEKNGEFLEKDSPLGKNTVYSTSYDKGLLYQLPRSRSRKELKIEHHLPFTGVDMWNCFEICWLDLKGKPHVAFALLTVPCESPFIFESKSLKLYLNSFNKTKFATADVVKETMIRDLSAITNADVEVALAYPNDFSGNTIDHFEGICIDDIDVEITDYHVKSDLLQHAVKENANQYVTETLYSHLLRSNCLITHQPDWGSVSITYTGPKIDREALLKYIVSFFTHNEFHEPCIEKIFVDILKYCRPIELTVHGRYTRRGGIDINPYRTTNSQFTLPQRMRLFRQ